MATELIPLIVRIAMIFAAVAVLIGALQLRQKLSAGRNERLTKPLKTLWPRFWAWFALAGIVWPLVGTGSLGTAALMAALVLPAQRELSSAFATIETGARFPMHEASRLLTELRLAHAMAIILMIGVVASGADGLHTMTIWGMALTVLYVVATPGIGERLTARLLILRIVRTGALWLYPALPLAMLVTLRSYENGFALVAYLLLTVALADVFAMLGGLAFGRTRLVPRLSPGKTVEGMISGAFGACLGALLIAFAFPDVPKPILFAAATFFSVVGLAGDLLASAIKRIAGLKDFGTILPGHGGIMDRIDSLLLAAPVAAIFLPRMLTT